MNKHHEEKFWIKRKEGKLYFHLWLPEDLPRATICLVHGLGDYSDCFLPLISHFITSGYSIYAVDLYGSGHSDGLRGDVPNYHVFMEEIFALLQLAQNRTRKIPIYLYGHSMGGNLVLNYALRYKPDIAGIIASAAWLKMADHPLGRQLRSFLISRVFPTYRYQSKLYPEKLSHDANYRKYYSQDPLIHGYVSARLFEQVSAAGNWVLRHADETQLPTLLIHGEKDMITSPNASKLYVKNSHGNASYKGFSGDYHTLHQESNRQEVFDFISNWIGEVTNYSVYKKAI
ncbi:MAG TPA: lysophospholipase [Ruminococcaceae bacterium]|nr:lysophospholipase [Oscillospiraceae bacterium]